MPLSLSFPRALQTGGEGNCDLMEVEAEMEILDPRVCFRLVSTFYTALAKAAFAC